MTITISNHWKEICNYIGLTEKQIKLLHQYQPLMKSKSQQVIVNFYNRMAQIPHLADIAESHSTFQRLTKTQLDYFVHLFSDRIDEDYIEYVSKIGAAHARIGLEPDWYISGVNIYMDEMASLCEGIVDGISLYQAFTKRLLFDTKIALHAYDRLKENNDYKEKMIELSDEMLQNLAMLAEVAATHSNAIACTDSEQSTQANEIDFLAKELLRVAERLHEEAQ